MIMWLNTRKTALTIFVLMVIMMVWHCFKFSWMDKGGQRMDKKEDTQLGAPFVSPCSFPLFIYSLSPTFELLG